MSNQNEIPENIPEITDDKEGFISPDEEVKKSEAGIEHHHHHHHSHHHHSHGHHHHHKHRSKKTKIKRFAKKHKKELQISAIVAVALLFVAAIIIAEVVSDKHMQEIEQPEKPVASQINDEMVYIGLPMLEREVQLHKDVVNTYLDSDIDVTIISLLDDISSVGTRRLDCPNAVKLEFDVYHTPNSMAIESAQLEISETEDFKNSSKKDIDNNYSVNLYNLKTGTTYFYKAHFKLSNDKVMSYSGSFKTASGPRFMNIEGAYNVRDIGGWKTTDGKTIKQGLLYRGTELDGAVEPGYKLTQDGVNEMVLSLGIKFDLDLRAPSDSVDGTYILGSNVKHKYYDMSMYADIFKNASKPRVKAVFSDLAKESNYPVYLHCTYGRDRTGSMCYILEALLGVSEDDLLREYELSALYNGYLVREDILKLRDGLMKYEGATMKQKAENYLLDCGVTKAEIEAIRDIFLAE